MGYQYAALAAVAILSWLIYILLYRLFLHPLAHIPGPRLPAATAWYSTFYDCFYHGGGQYPFKIKEFHESYGPIIRIAPDEVHISDANYLDTIYALRDRNSLSGKGLMVDQSVGFTEDFALHKLRRDALNPFFSAKAVLELQPLLTSKVDKLRAILDARSSAAQVLNLSDAFFAFSNDILRSYCFGDDNALLDDILEANRQREDFVAFVVGVYINNHFSTLVRGMTHMVTMVKGVQALPPALRELMGFRADIKRDIEAVLSDKTNDKKGVGRSIFYELRDTPLLPPHEKTVARLQDEATLLVMAGTGSPAAVLTCATFYMLWQPSITQKLRSELEAAQHSSSERLSVNTLLHLPYLQAIIDEANRLSFGITPRMRYDIRDTATHANEQPDVLRPHQRSLFPDPWRFDPDRWLGNTEEVSERKRAMRGFGKGHRKCLGISLANAATSLALAAVAEYGMELVDTDESDVKFQYDFQMALPKLDSKGVQAVIKSKITIA